MPRLDDPWLSSRMAEYAAVRRAESQLYPAVYAACEEFLGQVKNRMLGKAMIAAAFDVPEHLVFAEGEADPPPDDFPGDNAWQRAIDNHIRPVARRLFDGAYYRIVAARESAQTRRDRSSDYLSGLGERMSGFRLSVWERLRRFFNRGPQPGETPAQLRERLAQLLSMEEWDGQVMTLTRTETMTALNAGAFAGAFDEQERTGEPWEKRWQATDDQRVRHTHAAADGQIRPLHDPFEIGGHQLQFPGDPLGPAGEVINCRCVLPETRVAGAVTAAMRRQYDGPVFKLKTASGHELTTTPEHPVLTLRGWVRADDLKPGDQLIRAGREVERALGVSPGPQVGDREPTAQQVYDALALAALVTDGRRGRAVHLNGQDPSGQHVDCVLTADVLPLGGDTPALQLLSDLGVARADREAGFPADGQGLGAAHAQPLSGGPVTRLHPEVREALLHQLPPDTEFSGHRLDGHGPLVQLQRAGGQLGATLPVGQGVSRSTVAELHPGPSEPGVDGLLVEPGLRRYLRDAHGLVQLDQLLSADQFPFSGHVYDLTCVTNSYLANGYIVHNCAARYAPAQDPSLTASSTPGEDPTMATPVTTETPGPVQVSPSGRWRGVLGFMDEWSADQRMLESPDGGVRSRPLPLPLLVQGALANGHDGGELGVGVIDRIWTEGNAVWGEGRFDMDDPVGAQLARKVGLGFIRFVSLDVDDATAAQVLIDADGNVVENGDPNDRSLAIGDVYSGWRVMGATLLAHPAFPNAAIALADDSGETLTASAYAEIVGYNPDWGCVKADGDAWVTADCEDPDAVPANPTGDGPFDPEQGQGEASLEGVPGSLAAADEAPAEDDAADEPVEPEEPPSDIAADEEQAAEELDPHADGPAGCVTQNDDGTWSPADCETPGAVPANPEGTGPAEVEMAAKKPTPPADEEPPAEGDQPPADSEEGDDEEKKPKQLAAQPGPPADCEPCQAVTITAAATGTLAPGWTPPAEWFQQPTGTGGAHSIRVDVETGRVSGYLAAWGSCHVGYKNRCVPPPHSVTDYAYFNVRPVNTSDGVVYCGLLTMGTGHASLSASANAALAHYDNTGTQAAVVRVGEDNHGIWAVGAVLPFLSAEDRLRLSLASFSGDWREVRGGAELIAALAVNSPGFPLAARKTGADNRPYALVAAGALMPEPPAQKQPPGAVEAVISVDASEVAALVVKTLDEREVRRERHAFATGKLAALRADHSARTRAAFERRVAAAKGKVVRVQRPKAGEPPMEMVGLDKGLPTPSTQDIGLARNWVDEQGGLPPYIARISKHLEAKGMDKGRAIATAVNASKKMCASGDLQWPGIQHVNPGSRAEACAAVVRWEEMKAAARAS